MRGRQQFIFLAVVMIIAMLGCQSRANPIPGTQAKPAKPAESLPGAEVEPTKPAEILPSAQAEPTKPAEILPTLDPRHATKTAFEAKAEFEANIFHTFVSNIVADPNTACVFHRFPYALSCLNKDGWHVYELDTPILFTQCPDGRIYLGWNDKLYIQENNTLSEIKTGYLGAGFACGPGNEFWLVYPSALSHFDGTAWTDYQAADYLGDAGYDLGDVIAVAPNGNLWLTTKESVATFDGTNWQSFETGKLYDGKPYPPQGLAVDANGNVWYIDVDGLRKYDGAQWSTFPNPKGFSSNFVTTLDHENRIWVEGWSIDNYNPRHSSTIYSFDPQTNSWILQFDDAALNGAQVRAMQFDSQNRLWVTTDYGLFIHDGSEWTTYHTYTSDLYSNAADAIVVLGDGPQLPAPTQKAPGSIRGKVVIPNSPSNLQVEICVEPWRFEQGITPCAHQAYHALTTMDADGNFLFKDVPVGKYYLMIQVSSSSWSKMIDLSSIPSPDGAKFEVYPGTETRLGEIKFSPTAK